MEKLTSYDQEIQPKLETASSVTNENQNHAEIHQLDQEAANTLSSGNGNQHRHDQLINSIKEMAESLEPPLSSNNCCIYRVPTWLRKLNEEAYTPQVISLGPFHHGSKRLETMEKLKLKYFKKFLQLIDFKDMEILVNTIKKHEESVRSCYAETIEFSSDDFVKLILVDGIFIIEFFYKIRRGLIGSDSTDIHDDNIFINRISWELMLLDLQLLENQLPFFVLDILLKVANAVSDDDDECPSFTLLAIDVFEILIREHKFPGNLEGRPIRHFVDLNEAFLIRPFSSPQESIDLASVDQLLSQQESIDLANVDHLYTVSELYQAGGKFKVSSCKCLPDLTRHFAEFARPFFLPSSKKLLSPQESTDLPSADHLYSASQLYEAGVKFKKSSSEYLLDLKFTNGTLEIPQMILYDRTETFYRNVIAFEQCHFPYDSKFIDYIVLLSFLINTPKDADLLIRKGIIVNWLPNSKAVASSLTNMFINVTYNGSQSIYRDLFKGLNAFYENTKHTWKATLKRDYFSTPWKIASTAAAITLLLLTLLQTICSIIQVVKI